MDNKLNKMIESFPVNGSIIINEIEDHLLKLIASEKNNIEYIIQYALVLLIEPNLDYERAYNYLANKDDIRAILLRCYIEDWYYGIPPKVNKEIADQYHNRSGRSVEYSCLLYYASFNSETNTDIIALLIQSLQVYPYNFQSIIKVNSILNEYKESFNIGDYIEKCIRFNNRLNRTSFFNNKLLFKPFMYSKMLGLNRTTENILLLRRTFFTSNNSKIGKCK